MIDDKDIEEIPKMLISIDCKINELKKQIYLFSLGVRCVLALITGLILFLIIRIYPLFK